MTPVIYRTSDKVFLKGYGHASQAQLAALESRVMLPYDKPGGGYYVGTKSKSGRIISEKPPYYGP